MAAEPTNGTSLPTYNDPELAEKDKESPTGGILEPELRNADGSSLRSRSGEDILGLEDFDPALNMKMHLINNVSE